MARGETEAIVTQSVLDRLIDREPRDATEPPPTRAQSVRQLKASLRRDLEWLLNTRRIAEEAPESFEELNRSLYNYGLPDFSAMSFSNPRDRTRLLRSLEASIRLFEPRLDAVKVIPVEVTGEAQNKRLLRFQIEGLLKMDPAPEQVSFDTVLQLTNGEYEVKGERGA
jgi:type VI secretion system protein ImpF